ncbi:MAG: hypothetical protein LBJ08_03295 [Bifidobacteriaceae bacterium]|jgi:hypothetical protein|nr:hypothetical protein [Bifidobacteriaceae bacterium]
MKVWLKPWLVSVSALVWMYCLAYSFEPVLFGSYVYMPTFMGLVALSMAIVGRLAIQRIGALVRVCIPVGSVLTLAMY